MGGESYGNRTQWYSFPGSCPSQPFPSKSSDCRKQQPGGQCSSPNGTEHCTWNMQLAGDVSLDALQVTQSVNRSGAPITATAEQVRLLFREKYPKTELPEPTCSSQNAQCQYHQKCRGLSGSCCPATNGKFL